MDAISSFIETAFAIIVLIALCFVALMFTLKEIKNLKDRAYLSLGLIAALCIIGLGVTGYQAIFGDDSPKVTYKSSPPTRAITAKDLRYPEVGIPGHVAPEKKKLYLNYEKGKPPVAIRCDEAGCEAAK
ncbi:hypothetical protein ACVCL3_16925 [Rhodanobacter sp. UC4437_H4]